ncbi:MAG: 2-C-methyl-D-erythritol 2,4-cyclodiphosphate synthase [Thermomicrobia bacterium]|nr:2-C-methyl-D-erythritol 2,4-cyclodiphosphate synthase [Thermomicrobia bacterium]MCA1722796.1 2-C-methyl-D-erythritol 2,4-cyclodiphosphate synthase [Thermomicrobia bacterium]
MGDPAFRVGIGYDVHRLVAGRPLILGGVRLPFAQGLDGHSDADVLLHAITDALLGAAALGDIGTYFPPTDAAWKDADSRDLLRVAVGHLRAAGWATINIDATVVCEAPKLQPHAAAIRASIAETVGIAIAGVSVKGKTSEGLGFTGRGEGIAAHVVALIQRQAGEGT